MPASWINDQGQLSVKGQLNVMHKALARLCEKAPPSDIFLPEHLPQGLGKHLVDNAPSVGILSCSKNPIDARDKNIQQRAESLSLAGS